MNNWSLPVALFATVFVSNVSATIADDFGSKARASFEPIVKQYDIPGLMVGITRNGVHEFYAVGLASRADNRPVTQNTLFELGSMSRVFNVTLAALAEQRGKLSLDDTVADHLCTDVCLIGDKLKLMDFAAHHSGGLPLRVPDDVPAMPSMIGWLKNWPQPQPSARSYSNISIGMLS